MRAMAMVLVLAAVVFAEFLDPQGSAGFGTGGMGQITEPGVMPFTASLEMHYDVGPLVIGEAGYFLSWHSQYSYGGQEMLLVGLQTVGVDIQGTRFTLGAGVADMATDFRSGSDRLQYDMDLAAGLRWDVTAVEGIEVSAVYLWSATEREPLFGGLLVSKTL